MNFINEEMIAASTHIYSVSVSWDKGPYEWRYYVCRDAQILCVCKSGQMILWIETFWLQSLTDTVCPYLEITTKDLIREGIIAADPHRYTAFVSQDYELYERRQFGCIQAHISLYYVYISEQRASWMKTFWCLLMYYITIICVWYCLVYSALPSVIYNI